MTLDVGAPLSPNKQTKLLGLYANWRYHLLQGLLYGDRLTDSEEGRTQTSRDILPCCGYDPPLSLFAFRSQEEVRTVRDESAGLRAEVKTLDHQLQLSRASVSSLETQLTTSQVRRPRPGSARVRIPRRSGSSCLLFVLSRSACY